MEDFALIGEGSALYLVNAGPRGPIRNIPRVASRVLTVRVPVPEGYTWIAEAKGRLTGYRRTLKTRKGAPVVQIRTQIALRDTLRFLAPQDHGASPQFRILVEDQTERIEMVVGGIVRGDTVLLPMQFDVEGDRVWIRLQEQASWLEKGVEIYPNPFRLERDLQGATIRFRLREPSRVRVVLYDEGGHVVRRWRLSPTSEEIRIVWNGRDHRGRRVPNGVYFVEARAESGEKGWGKIIVVRR